MNTAPTTPRSATLPANDIGFSTPPAQTLASEQAERTNFLRNVAGREDLSPLCKLMDELFGKTDWAFTGSMALFLHTKINNPANHPLNRIPSDADILIRDTRLNRLTWNNLEQSENCARFSHAVVSGEKKLHILSLDRGSHQDPLKIDLVGTDNRGFGDITSKDSGLLEHHLPVLSLDSLQSALLARRSNEGDNEKTRSDLNLIENLLKNHPQDSNTQPDQSQILNQPNLRFLGKRRRSEEDSADQPGKRSLPDCGAMRPKWR